MQMLLYCVYIKRRSEAASLALGLLLKLWHAPVFSAGEISTYTICWQAQRLTQAYSTV